MYLDRCFRERLSEFVGYVYSPAIRVGNAVVVFAKTAAQELGRRRRPTTDDDKIRDDVRGEIRRVSGKQKFQRPGEGVVERPQLRSGGGRQNGLAKITGLESSIIIIFFAR